MSKHNLIVLRVNGDCVAKERRARSRAAYQERSLFSGMQTETAQKADLVALTISSWNQTVTWLQEMDSLRREASSRRLRRTRVSTSNAPGTDQNLQPNVAARATSAAIRHLIGQLWIN